MDSNDFIYEINRYIHEFRKEPHKLNKFSIFHKMMEYIIENQFMLDKLNTTTKGSFRSILVCKIDEFLREGMSKRKSARYIRVLNV
jgi:hypothetical protein